MMREWKYRKVAGVRTRAVTEAECLMAFSPLAPQIQWLDLNAWLIFELCDGHTRAEVERAYLDVRGARVSREEAHRQLHAGIQALIGSKLIEQGAAFVKGEIA